MTDNSAANRAMAEHMVTNAVKSNDLDRLAKEVARFVHTRHGISTEAIEFDIGRKLQTALQDAVINILNN